MFAKQTDCRNLTRSLVVINGDVNQRVHLNLLRRNSATPPPILVTCLLLVNFHVEVALLAQVPYNSGDWS